MKNWLRTKLRNWLGVKDIDEVDFLNRVRDVIRKDDIERDIEYRVLEWMKDKERGLFLKNISDVQKAVRDEVENGIRPLVDDHINKEEFIDKIIRRIKNKQLS